MRLKRVIIQLTLALLLTGCSTQKEASHMFVTQYANSEGTRVVYDQSHRVYSLSDDTYKQISDINVTQQPAIMYTPVHAEYSMSENIPGNYSCSINDAFAYVTEQLEHDYILDKYEYTPYICKVDLKKGDALIRLYIEKDTTRIYCWNEKGEPVAPEFKCER